MEQIELRPLQEVALKECRRAFSHTKRFILKATCGFGKTVLSAYFIKRAVDNGIKCLFVVDRIVLAEQTDAVFAKYGISCGIIQADNEKYFPDRQVQIGSIQTLNRRDIDQYGLILIDECHCHHDAHTKLMEKNKDAFIMGLTSTPYAKDLGKYYDFFIEPVTVKEMVKNGELVPFDIYAPSVADLSKLKIRAGDYTEESLSEAYDQVDIIGDVVNVWKKLTPGKKTIVFGVNVAHIKHLAKEFNRVRVSACQINAYQSKTEREEALSGFINGGTMVLCSVEVATKGFDCPAVEVVALAVATKSSMKWEQTTGRGLRLSPGKDKCTILDFGGNAERLGFPDEHEFLHLDDGNKYGSKTKQKERPEQLPKACPSCEFVKPPGVRKCPACGFEPDFVEDVETGAGELEKLKRKAKKEFTLSDKQSFLSQLNQYAFEKGYKMGRESWPWSRYKYKDKFGSDIPSRLKWDLREPLSAEVKNFITSCNIRWAKTKNKEA